MLDPIRNHLPPGIFHRPMAPTEGARPHAPLTAPAGALPLRPADLFGRGAGHAHAPHVPTSPAAAAAVLGERVGSASSAFLSTLQSAEGRNRAIRDMAPSLTAPLVRVGGIDLPMMSGFSPLRGPSSSLWPGGDLPRGLPGLPRSDLSGSVHGSFAVGTGELAGASVHGHGYSASVALTGPSASGWYSAGVDTEGARLGAGVDATLLGLVMGGAARLGPLHAQAAGNARVGGRAQGHAEVDFRDPGLHAGASGFAGAEADAHGAMGVDGLGDVHGSASAKAGIGAEANADVAFQDGRLNVNAQLGLTLGLGAGFDYGFSLDPKGFAKDPLKALGMGAGMRGMQGLLGGTLLGGGGGLGATLLGGALTMGGGLLVAGLFNKDKLGGLFGAGRDFLGGAGRALGGALSGIGRSLGHIGSSVGHTASRAVHHAGHAAKKVGDAIGDATGLW